jgi:hypothetical protein
VVYIISLFQLEAIERGHFLRGAIVVDDIFQDKDVVFGPALIKAYRLERKLPIWPRIIIDTSILEELSDSYLNVEYRAYLLRDDNGISFLNYLRHNYINLLLTRRSDDDNHIEPPERIFYYHRRAILANLATQNARLDILSKYFAAASYHNEVIDELSDTLLRDAKYQYLDAEIKHKKIEELRNYKIDLTHNFNSLYGLK